MIVMTPHASPAEIEAVTARLKTTGVHVVVMPGELTTAIGAIGDPEGVAELGLEGMAGVDRVVPISRPYKLASSELSHEQPTIVEIDGRRIGGGDTFCLIAGPCTVESREQTLGVAHAVKDAGASMLRGGAFKPRTSPFAFKGLGAEALEILAEARAADRPSGRHRAARQPARRGDLRPRRRRSDRRAQHAELRPARGRRQARQARAAQARAEQLARRAPPGGRLHPQGGQRGRDPLRARHPHVRDRDALHARPRRRPVAQAPHPPAGHRRPEPRRRRPPPGRAASAAPPPRSARTGSSSRSTRTPRSRCATARRRSRPPASPHYARDVAAHAQLLGKRLA